MSCAVALQFLPSSSGSDVPGALVAEYISCDANVEHYETVYPMYIYKMKEYADVFKSENIGNDFCCNDELVGEFIDVLNLDQTQCDTFGLYKKEAVNFGLIKEQGG